MKNIIVIGISAAGVSAISKIRQLDKEAKITAITYETDLPYNKCLLADYLSKVRSESEIYTKNREFFESNNINLILGKRVIQICPQDNCVVLDSGEKLVYDKLLLATGLQPVVPSFAQIGAPNIFVFNTVSDAKSLNNYIISKNAKRAVVIGAGLTGVEVADSLNKRGVSVSLVEYHPRVLYRQLDLYGSEYIQNLMEQSGITLFLNSGAQFVLAADGSVEKVVVSVMDTATIPLDPSIHHSFLIKMNGTPGRRLWLWRTQQDERIRGNWVNGVYQFVNIDVDLVVLATGAKMECELFVNAGIEVSESGVVTDEYLRTNFENIYAAGDICRIKDIISGEYVQNSTWPDAVMQGMVAGFNIVGQPKSYSGALIINNSNFFEKDFFSSGNFNAYYPHSVTLKCDNNLLKICLDAQNLIRAFYIIGEPEHLSKIKSHVVMCKPVDEVFFTALCIQNYKSAL